MQREIAVVVRFKGKSWCHDTCPRLSQLRARRVRQLPDVAAITSNTGRQPSDNPRYGTRISSTATIMDS